MFIRLQKLPCNLEKFLHQSSSTVNIIRHSGAPAKVGKEAKKQRDPHFVPEETPLQMTLFRFKTG